MNTPLGGTLNAITRSADSLMEIRKNDVLPGDHVYVKTRNSIYVIRVDNGDLYAVSGGWFDQKGLSPFRIKINGCTWGGSSIKVDTIAACGLCLEFGNRLITSTIQAIIVVRKCCTN